MEQFIKDWFNNKQWWFNCSKEDDVYISKTYGNLLERDHNKIDYPFAELVLYDQIPRHVYRNAPNKDNKVKYYLDLALKRYKYIDVNSLTKEEWCFAHLPLRHTNDIKNIFHVIDLTWLKLSTTNNSPIIHRFLKASYEKCPINDQSHSILLLNESDKFDKFNIYKFSNILAHMPMVKPQPIDLKHHIVKKVTNYINQYNVKNIIMSISGGSDSMVLFYILSKLNVNITLVHINYCNRLSSNAEKDFVVSWANHLGYSVYVRNIKEINRDQCMKYDLRTTYESYTRNVRYNCYKNVASTTNDVVALGHNKDDCLENIFQNIAHQTKYENLNGMSVLLKQDDILFFRPLLDIPKDDIIEYAKEYNIPYLPTSTPVWSQRGKIRNSVISCMDNYNPLFIPSLHKLSSIMSDMYVLAQQTISKFVKKFTMYKEKNIIVWKAYMLIQEIENTELFWSLVFTTLLKDIHISKRALKNCHERVSTWKTNNINDKKEKIKIHLQKSITLFLEPYEGDMIIIYFKIIYN